MQRKNLISLNRNIFILCSILVFLFLIDCLFIYLAKNKLKTIDSIRTEKNILEKDRQIISTASELTEKYQNEIEIFSKVFPNEETIALFLNDLENVIKKSTNDYKFQFSSFNPLPEQDKLYLLLTVSMKVDMENLIEFMTDIENLPYMMHINSISINSPLGINEATDTRVNLKLYVQQPFTAK